MRNKRMEELAETAAYYASKKLGVEKDEVDIGVILGTGWGDALNLSDCPSMPIQETSGEFNLYEVEELFHDDLILNAKEAKKMNLVDEIF